VRRLFSGWERGDISNIMLTISQSYDYMRRGQGEWGDIMISFFKLYVRCLECLDYFTVNFAKYLSVKVKWCSGDYLLSLKVV